MILSCLVIGEWGGIEVREQASMSPDKARGGAGGANKTKQQKRIINPRIEAGYQMERENSLVSCLHKTAGPLFACDTTCSVSQDALSC